MKTKNRNAIIKAVLCFVLIAVLVGIVCNDYEQKLSYATINGYKINSFNGSNGQYLFLPGFASSEDIVKSYALKQESNLKIMQSSDIPAVFIMTQSGNLNSVYENKDNREAGTISVVNPDGTEDYSGGIKYIKGRGNYSWDNWDKKPFSICLKKEASLLGLGTGNKYALIANASDPTLIRNDVARDLEEAINLKYSHTGQFVDLYINGDYMGNYYLIDTLDIGKERIDITDLDLKMQQQLRGTSISDFPVYETPLIKGWNIPELLDDNTGGYLIEREFAGRYEVDYQENPSCFTTDYDEHFLVKSPCYCSKKQINYICSFVTDLEGAIRTGDGINPTTGKSYLDYMDVDSMAKKYLIEEFTKNYDSGVSSSYFYKDSDTVDSKLYAAPGWDYDMSLGNYLDWMDFSESGADGYIHMTNNADASAWWENLFDKPEFSQKVLDLYYEELHSYVLEEELSRIDSLADTLKASANMDYIRWKEMYDELGYIPGNVKEYDKLKQFIYDRIAFFDGE